MPDWDMGQSSLYCRYGCGVARAELPDKAFSQLSLGYASDLVGLGR
jgi:hypothetical protein